MSELSPSGADQTWLRSSTNVDLHQFDSILQKLCDYLVVEARPGTNPIYLLHSLTRAFLDYQLHQTSVAAHRYCEGLSIRLNHMKALYLRQPHIIQNNIEHLFVLIDRGLAYPPSANAALDFITEVHPRPIQAGFVHKWMTILEIARETAAKHQYPQGIFYALLSETFHERADFERMVTTAAQALQLAEEESDDIAYFRAATLLINYWDTNKNIDEVIRLHQAINDRRKQTLIDSLTSNRFVEALLFADEQWIDFLRRHGKIDAALSAGNLLKEQIANIPQLSARSQAIPYRILGLVYWTKGDYDRSILEYEHALQLDPEGNSLMVATLLGNLGLTYWSHGQIVEAIDVTRRAREVAVQQHLTLRQVKIAGNMGLFYLWQGRLDEALRELHDQLTQAENLAHIGETMRARGNTGVTLFHVGGSDFKAIQLLLQDARNARNQHLYEGFANACLYLGLLYGRVGFAKGGWRFITLALGVAIELQLEPLQVVALRAAAEYAPLNAKKMILDYALNLARDNQRLFDEAACLLSLAPLQTTKLRQQKAWNAAVAILRRMDALQWVQTYTAADPPFLPALT